MPGLDTPAAIADPSAAEGRTLRPLAGMPGPKGWPVLGNLPQIKPEQFHRQLGAWAQH